MDKGLLKRATEDSKEPTPGYMYKEIVKMTFLDLKTQDKVLEFLLDKLQDASNKSTYVLSKTLRVLKHICMEGHADCQKTIQKNAETIRTCANYRGKTDPTFGDMLNQQVRDAAREAMEAAFSTRRDNRNALVIGEGHGANKQQENSLSNSTFSTGYTVGATAHEASTHAVNVITTHVKAAVKNGFGLWKESPKTAKQKIIEEVQRQSTAQTHGQYQKLSVPVTEDTYNVHVPVPRSVMNDIAKDRGHNQHIEADWKNLGSETATLPSAKQQQQEEKSEHQKLVGKITSMKETPQRFELSNFFQSVSASVQRELCSWDEIVGELDAALAPTQGWQTRLNAVCCIETIIKQNVDVVVEHYTQAPEDLQRCVNVVQRTLKDRAEKVLTLLGVPHKLSRTSETGKRADVVASVFSGGADGKRDITWSSSLSASALANINENPLGELEGALKVKDRSGRSRGQNNKLRKRNANNNSTTAGVEHSDDHDSAMVQVNKVNHDCSSSSNGKAQQPASGSKKLDFMDELFSSDVTSSCQESHPSTLTQIPSAGAFLDPSLFQQGVVSTSMNAVEQPAPPAPMSAAEAADTWISNIANGMKTRTTMSQSNEGSSFTSVGTQPHANPKPVSNFGFMT